MKKLLLFVLLAAGMFGADAANDIVLSQRKADNSGFIQRNLAPTANAALGVDTNKVPVALTAFTQDSVTGAVSVAAAGTNQSITLTPTGTGGVNLAGNVGVGNAFNDTIALTIGTPDVSSGTNAFGAYGASTASSSITGTLAQFFSNPRTAAAAFTIATLSNFRASSAVRGAGSTITALEGFTVTNAMTQGTTNYGFRGSLAASGETRWNAYMDGTAPNLFGGAVVLPSTNTSGLQLYNTADQVTNTESGGAVWVGNVMRFYTASAGSGTIRQLELRNVTRGQAFKLGNSLTSDGFFYAEAPAISTAGMIGFKIGSTSTATSGTNLGLLVSPTYNQASGTASNTDFLINRTQTAVGSGAQLLIDAQVGGSSKFNVSNAGVVSVTNTTNPIVQITDGTRTGFMDINSAGTQVRFGSSSNNNVLLMQNGGTAVTIDTSKNVTLVGAIIATPQALSGAGAVNLTTTSTFYTSTGGAQALTLANGTAGKIKTIVHQVDGGSGVLTPTSAIGFTTITFTNAGDSVTLQYTSAGWAIIGIFGAVAA